MLDQPERLFEVPYQVPGERLAELGFETWRAAGHRALELKGRRGIGIHFTPPENRRDTH